LFKLFPLEFSLYNLHTHTVAGTGVFLRLIPRAEVSLVGTKHGNYLQRLRIVNVSDFEALFLYVYSLCDGQMWNVLLQYVAGRNEIRSRLYVQI